MLGAENDGLDNPIVLRNAFTEFRYSQDFLIHEALSFLPTITEVFNCPLAVLGLMRAKAILGRSNLTTAEETYWRDQLIRHLSNIEFWIPVNLTAYVIFKRLLDQDIVSKKSYANYSLLRQSHRRKMAISKLDITGLQSC